MTEQQYLELGQEVEEYVTDWIGNTNDPDTYTKDDLELFMLAICRMVNDRLPEPDDGP